MADLTTAIVERNYPLSARKRISNEISSLQNVFPTLLATQQEYVSDAGESQNVITLKGTIPSTISGSTFNIPMTIYLPLNFPSSAPVCYVTPTPTMFISPQHTFMDVNGLLCTPYLLQWDSSSEYSSSLLELVIQMAVIFGQHPPVYAKSANIMRPPGPPSKPLPQLPSPPSSQPPSKPLPQPPSRSDSSLNQKRKSDFDIAQTFKDAMFVRVKKEYAEFVDNNKEEMDQLLVTQTSLVEASYRLDQAQNEFRMQIHQVDQFIEEAYAEHYALAQSQSLQSHRQQQQQNGHSSPTSAAPHDANDLVAAGDALTHQLLEVATTDQAIEDTLYHLDRALDGGLGIDEYLRSVRQLSREQFTARALALKIHAARGRVPLNLVMLPTSTIAPISVINPTPTTTMMMGRANAALLPLPRSPT